MKNLSEKHRTWSAAAEILLPALAVLFGLQILRVMIPQMTWLLGDRFSLGAPILGVIAVVIFSFSFLSGILRRLTGSRRFVIGTSVGLGLARLLIQFQWAEPLVCMVISMAGTVLFGLFLAVYTDRIRSEGRDSIAKMSVGFLAGLVLDTALHGAFGTWDMMWQSGVLPLLITIFLVIVLWLAVAVLPRHEDTGRVSGGITWPWLAVGPFIFLQMVAFQNIARYTVATGWSPPYLFGWVMITQIAGLFTVVLLLRKNLLNLPVVAAGGIILVACTLFPFPGQSWTAAVLLTAEQVTVSALIVSVLIGTSSGNGKSPSGSVTAANGTGFLLMGLMTLAYYTGYQIKLPYTNTVLETVAAVIIALCAVVACLKTVKPVAPIKSSWLTPVLILVLLVVPGIRLAGYQEPEYDTGDGFPVKMMTYNLHNGFNTLGDMDLEALARVIEENDPEIIVLQEISRGWLISGRTDMLEWLSQRLDMPFVTGPTEGELWGNAILSRYPIIGSVNHELPPRDLFLRRGFLVTDLDIGSGETLTVIATHLHHLTDDSAIRQQQVPVILEALDDTGPAIITGDFNAEPDSPEIRMMRDAGLTDVMAGSIPPEGYTYHSADLFQRIDYIWITPGLSARNAGVYQSTASDHLPVIVELSR